MGPCVFFIVSFVRWDHLHFSATPFFAAPPRSLGIRDTRHAFFCEPSSLRNLLDFAPENATAFTTYANIVYAPHVYTGSFTVWSPPSYDFAYQTATTEARGRRGAVVVTEFGGDLMDAPVKLGGG